MNSVDNLCKWTDVVERAINTLWIDMRDLRGKAPMGEGDMFMLVEAMRAPKKTLGPIDSSMRSMGFLDEEVDEEATNVQRVMEASLRSAHSQGGAEFSAPFEQCHGDVDDAINEDDEEKLFRECSPLLTLL